MAASDVLARHLLVVDDDDRIRELLKEFLSRNGFRVTIAAHAGAARRLMELLDFDLIILDVMMPGEDGISLAKSIAKTPTSTPILMLTARGGSSDRIEGLSAGADDYLAKPFEPQELLLRIEAILRRMGARPAPLQDVALGRFKFDLERSELSEEGQIIRLTEAEAQLLKTLAQNAHVAVERHELIRDEADATGRAVDVQVTRLRRKIEDDPRNPRYLQTVRGIGYMLAPD